MACNPTILRQVPLFALLDDEETAVLAGQVEVKTFAPRQRIYKMGEPGDKAYVMVSGAVRVTTVDEDHQEVMVDQPRRANFLASLPCWSTRRIRPRRLARKKRVPGSGPPRHSVLLQRKPMAGMDMLTVLGRQFHASQQLVRVRANRNANEMIEEEETFGERVADIVASFGGSWTFIIAFGMLF